MGTLHMGILQYQLVIFSLVIGLTYVKRRYGLYTAIILTAWSIVMLHKPSLIALQLCVVWVSWYGADLFFRKRDKQEEASADSREMPHAPATAVHERAPSGLSIVHGTAHARELREAFAIANNEILIVSGWISDKVINDHFCSLLTRALERGVDIHISYGASEWDGSYKISETGKRALEKLQMAANKSQKGRLMINQRPTHEKFLAVDDQYAIVGSFNWLSNTRHNDKETSLKTSHKQVIAGLIASSKNEATRHSEVYGGAH